MNDGLTRRGFLQGTVAAAAGMALTGAVRAEDTPAYGPLKNSLLMGMFPNALSYDERIKMAKACGFDGIEMSPMTNMDEAKRLGELAHKEGIAIHSIIYGGWGEPLSDPDPAVVKKGHEAVERAMKTAQAVGADNILLVPAVVTEKVRYVEAYERSQKEIRELIPMAEKYNVIIGVEEVWNKFLLSPLEFAKYIDEFNSKWVRAYFDVGNVVIYGYPEDWIRTLGSRILRVHIKDFKREGYKWTPLYEGDVNWAEVRKAFHEIGYTGWINAELPSGDEVYLKELNRRMKLIGQGAKSI
jgi:L-ribulose-5-phosphate 3-epimerase